MLLPPDTAYQAAQFPTAAQLSSTEREALRAELPGLTEAMLRTTRSYLGPEVSLEAPELLWRQSDRAQLATVTGPALVTEFGGGHQLVVRLSEPLADGCVGSLLGYATAPGRRRPGLTGVDLAILRPYLESLADNLVRRLFRSRGRHKLLPARLAPQLTDSDEVVALLFPLEVGGVRGEITITGPVEAWRTEVAASQATEQSALGLRQLQQVAVRLEAVLPAVSLSLIEVATMEPGDVVPFPQGEELIVHLQAGDRVVAAGRAGAQGGLLGVRVLNMEVSEESGPAMNDNTIRDQQVDTQASPQELMSQLRIREQAGLESLAAIPVDIQIKLGEVSLPLAELLELRAGSVVTLNKGLGERVEVLAGDRIVAYGEIVAVEGQLGVRILQLADSEPA